MVSEIISKSNPTITVRRQFSDLVVNIVFDANGGICTTTGKTYHFPTDKYGTLPTPTRIGYKFLGWYTEKDNGSGTKVLTTTEVAAKTRTIYAHWVKLNVNLTGAVIADDDGSYAADMNSSTTYNLMPKPKKANWFFAGWYTVATHGTGTTQIKSTTTINDSITEIYGHWVELDVQSGTFPDETTTYYTDETYYTSLPIPTRPNYKFVGWYTELNTGTKIRTSTYTALNDSYSKFYAYWVYFDANGGTLSSSTIVASENTSITYNTMPLCNTQTNKQFLGWFTTATGGTKQFNSSTIVNNQTTLYAHWLYFNTEGGTDVTPSQSSSATTTNYNSLPVPTKANNKFLGWFTTENSSGVKKLTSNTIDASLFTVYARWLSFNSEGGISITSTTASDNNSNVYGTLPYSDYSGKKFLGWFTTETNGSKILESTVITSLCTTPNTVVYARWMSFDSKGGSSITSTTASNNGSNTYGTLPYSSVNGKKFLGWYNAETGGTKYLEGNNITLTAIDTTVYAHWVTMDSNGGVAITTVESARNTDNLYYTMPTTTNEGYHLVGWFTDNSTYATEKTATSTIDTSVDTLYIKWLEKKTVSFNPMEGTVSPTEKMYAPGYKYGVYGLPTPSRSGYGFIGWFETIDYSTPQITDETIFDGLIETLYAKWINSDIITYNPNGGTCSVTSNTHTVGNAYSVVGLPTPTRSGYVFEGWHIDSESGTKIGLDTIAVGRVITVYAKWISISADSWQNLLSASLNCMSSTNIVTVEQEVTGSQAIAKNTSVYSNTPWSENISVSQQGYYSTYNYYSYFLKLTMTKAGTLSFKYRAVNGNYTYYNCGRTLCYLKNSTSSRTTITSYGNYSCPSTAWTNYTISIPTGTTIIRLQTYGYKYYSSSSSPGFYVSDFKFT